MSERAYEILCEDRVGRWEHMDLGFQKLSARARCSRSLFSDRGIICPEPTRVWKILLFLLGVGVRYLLVLEVAAGSTFKN